MAMNNVFIRYLEATRSILSIVDTITEVSFILWLLIKGGKRSEQLYSHIIINILKIKEKLRQLIATKLYIPPPRSKLVLRSRLIERLNEGMQRKLTLISAPAGFGKTTLVSEWIVGCKRPVAWFSLDVGDNDPLRFLTYFVSALQTISVKIGGGVLEVAPIPSVNAN
jgi:hypothetical protein